VVCLTVAIAGRSWAGWGEVGWNEIGQNGKGWGRVAQDGVVWDWFGRGRLELNEAGWALVRVEQDGVQTVEVA
jgi:hypothetical protein